MSVCVEELLRVMETGFEPCSASYFVSLADEFIFQSLLSHLKTLPPPPQTNKTPPFQGNCERPTQKTAK